MAEEQFHGDRGPKAPCRHTQNRVKVAHKTDHAGHTAGARLARDWAEDGDCHGHNQGADGGGAVAVRSSSRSRPWFRSLAGGHGGLLGGNGMIASGDVAITTPASPAAQAQIGEPGEGAEDQVKG